jgi:hypothetical protein
MSGHFVDAAGATWIVDSLNPLRISIIADSARRSELKNIMRYENSCRFFLQFNISQNEEHCYLTIREKDKNRLNLGERAHHYTLLTLARQRLKDARCGIEQESQGWIEIEKLSKMLGLDVAHINIQIFRARNQIARVYPPGAELPGIVERRRGEVRFGTVRAQIVRGSSIEGEFNPNVVSHQEFFCANATELPPM